jgi:hypothetical protein
MIFNFLPNSYFVYAIETVFQSRLWHLIFQITNSCGHLAILVQMRPPDIS